MLRFELMTSQTWYSSHNHYRYLPGLPHNNDAFPYWYYSWASIVFGIDSANLSKQPKLPFIRYCTLANLSCPAPTSATILLRTLNIDATSERVVSVDIIDSILPYIRKPQFTASIPNVCVPWIVENLDVFGEKIANYFVRSKIVNDIILSSKYYLPPD